MFTAVPKNNEYSIYKPSDADIVLILQVKTKGRLYRNGKEILTRSFFKIYSDIVDKPKSCFVHVIQLRKGLTDLTD